MPALRDTVESCLRGGLSCEDSVGENITDPCDDFREDRLSAININVN